MSTDQFYIKSRALEMFQSGQGADCVIEVVQQIDGQEKQEFKVHKYVLMVNSDVFCAMFSHQDTKEACEGHIQISDSTTTAVHQMLIYLYTGELPKEYAMETDAVPLLHIANKYKIQALVEKVIWTQLIKTKKLAYFKMNRWNGPKSHSKISENGTPTVSESEDDGKAAVSEDGLGVNNQFQWNAIFAVHGFPITEHCRKNNFPGTIVYYFEAKGDERRILVGLSNGNIPTQGKYADFSDSSIKSNPNCYAISNEEEDKDFCYIDGEKHELEWSEEAVKLKWHRREDVIGCGLILNPENKLAVFFTKNGNLMGKKIAISPYLDMDCLYPTVEIYNAWAEANFGGNPAKPFKFDIEKCPGLDLE